MKRESLFNILSFKNTKATLGINQKVSFEAFIKLFSKTERTKETSEEYQEWKKHGDERALKCKDKGCFIAGISSENKRKAQNIISRNMVTLDLDNCPTNILDIIEDFSKELKKAFFVYSTHSHTKAKPRLRVIFPLNRDVSPEEYVAIAFQLGQKIGMDFLDATTFQVARVMYAPTTSLDGDFYSKTYNMFDEYVEPDDLLEEYFDYKDISQFQRPFYFEGKKAQRISRGVMANSTKTKYAMVNNFNLTYSIKEAIDTFLPDIYTRESDDRYSYALGESKNGLNILNSQYAFSFHGSDPAQGKLLNAFDIVRIHKFGNMDNADDFGRTKENNLGSFKEMCSWIRTSLPNVMANDIRTIESKKTLEKQIISSTPGLEIKEEKKEEISNNLALIDELFKDEKSGTIKKVAWNIYLIVEKDYRLKDLFFWDTIKHSVCFTRAPFWNSDIKKGDEVRDIDFSHIRKIICSPPYFLSNEKVSEDAVRTSAFKKRINYPKQFLSELPLWDGKERIETIFCELFGVQDCAFVREASKKWFTALVARIMRPGIKFDSAIALLGAVGIGKSTWGKSLIAVEWNGEMKDIDLAKHYFSDKALDLRNERDTIDALRGNCVVELAEFDRYFTKYDKATLKSFLTNTVDKFIPRFGHGTEDVPRSFVYLATSNSMNPIKDPEDERRFWPFYCGLKKNEIRIFNKKYWNKDIRDQVLAEALEYYNQDYNFAAPFEPYVQKQLDALIETASLNDDYIGQIEEYVENEFPKNFLTYDFEDMRKFWRKGAEFPSYDKNNFREKRDCFSIKEIWTVLLGNRKGDTPKQYQSKEIKADLTKLGYEFQGSKRKRFGVEIGQQQYFIKKDWSKTSIEDLEGEILRLQAKKDLGDFSEQENNFLERLLKLKEDKEKKSNQSDLYKALELEKKETLTKEEEEELERINDELLPF